MRNKGMGNRILVVEDEANIAEYLVSGLREEGYAVEHAADGDSAWQHLQAGSGTAAPDWWLPGRDGLSLLQLFRARIGARPVLFLTARDQVQARIAGLDGGARTTYASRLTSTSCWPASAHRPPPGSRRR